MRKKATKVLTNIFSVGLAACLVIGLLAAVLLLAAFFVGQENATVLCAFINARLLPTIYVAGAILALLGVAKMYVAGEKNFFVDVFHKNKQTDSNWKL